MTSVAFEPQDIYYQAVHRTKGIVWVSDSGKDKFRRAADIKTAWKQVLKKSRNTTRLGSAVDIEPLKVLKPIRSTSLKGNRYIWPTFDEQNVYVIVERKTHTLLKLEESLRLLRIVKAHVEDLGTREEINKLLSSDWKPEVK